MCTRARPLSLVKDMAQHDPSMEKMEFDRNRVNRMQGGGDGTSRSERPTVELRSGMTSCDWCRRLSPLRSAPISPSGLARRHAHAVIVG